MPALAAKLGSINLAQKKVSLELPLSNSNPKQENSNFFLTNFWGKF